MIERATLLIFLSVSLVSCSLVETGQPSSPTSGEHTSQATALPPVETAAACTPTLPNEEPLGDPYETILEEFSIVAPSSSRLYGLIRRPDPNLYPNLCFAAVILVPGGINPGRTAAYDDDAMMLATAGMVVITFNAEGRVDTRSPEDLQSEGTQDYNGYRDQDGLCAVVQYTIGLDYVVADNVGLASYSFGITTAAGCAARHPEIPIKYIVDGEGPPDSFVTCHEPESLDADPSNDMIETIYEILGHYSTYRDSSPENQAFWIEREAIRFIGAFRGRYLRLQATWDHAQPPQNETEIPLFDLPPLWWHNKHTTDIVNSAVVGNVPWVRVNLPEQGNPINVTYDYDHPPVYLPGALADRPWVVRAVIEMARTP
ncbi:MAG: hypothetical protein AB1531_03420 [Chloroflexota bacterium]